MSLKYTQAELAAANVAMNAHNKKGARIARRGDVIRALWTLMTGLMLLAVSGCATYSDRVAPVPLPSEQTKAVDVGGVQLIAEAYVESRAARETFGFDIRGAGLLPVRFVVENNTEQTVRVTPDQTFLVDNAGQAWPLLTSEQAYKRVEDHVELGETVKATGKPALLAGAAGAVIGAAVGIVSGRSAGDAAARGAAAGAAVGAVSGGFQRHQALGYQIRDDLARESLRNRRVTAGELAYGFLFFPGKGEAKSAKHLRLGLKIGETQHIVNLSL